MYSHYCSIFLCAILCVHSSFTIILMGKTELVVLSWLSSWCFVIVVWLFVVWLFLNIFLCFTTADPWAKICPVKSIAGDQLIEVSFDVSYVIWP